MLNCLKSIRANELTFAAILILAPGTAQADCLPSAPAGWKIPFTMVTQNVAMSDAQGHKMVSYTAGQLTSIAWALGVYWSVDAVPQLFADRDAFCNSAICSPQPFDVHQADSIKLGISEAYIPPGSPISVGITLNSWGNATFNFSGHCDSNTGLLYGSFNKDTMVIIGFGIPHP